MFQCDNHLECNMAFPIPQTHFPLSVSLGLLNSFFKLYWPHLLYGGALEEMNGPPMASHDDGLQNPLHCVYMHEHLTVVEELDRAAETGIH